LDDVMPEVAENDSGRFEIAVANEQAGWRHEKDISCR